MIEYDEVFSHGLKYYKYHQFKTIKKRKFDCKNKVIMK